MPEPQHGLLGIPTDELKQTLANVDRLLAHLEPIIVQTLANVNATLGKAYEVLTNVNGIVTVIRGALK